MRQTLFYIPEHLGGLPTFGVGIVLALWIVGCLAYLGWTVGIRKQALDWIGTLPIMVLGAGVIWKILPMMVEHIPGDGRGLPVRGYGVMLLLAMVAAVLLAIHRSRQVGFPSEAILTMTFFAFICGIGGARLFYVVQKWDEQFYRPGDLIATLQAVGNVTQGGLVVYGGFIGGSLGVLGYLLWAGLPVFRAGDIAAPSLMIGLAIGRIGCLMNGCCYGGMCGDSWMGLEFPAGSVPYLEQLQRGTLVGAKLVPDPEDRRIDVVAVTEGSVADQKGIREGDRLTAYQINPDPKLVDAFVDPKVAESVDAAVFKPEGREEVYVGVDELPKRSLALYPTQLFASIDAALLCALLWFAYPFRTREGQIFGALLILYPVTRFVEESIRDDVGGYFGTSLTISQFVSLSLLVVALFFWIGVYALSPPIVREDDAVRPAAS